MTTSDTPEPTTEPIAPESLPKYLAEGLPKQDIGTLEDVIEYAEELIEYKDRALDLSELPENAEIVEQNDWSIITTEKVKCGDDSCWCSDAYPDDGHGPYRYRYFRDESGDQTSEYLGKA